MDYLPCVTAAIVPTNYSLSYLYQEFCQFLKYLLFIMLWKPSQIQNECRVQIRKRGKKAFGVKFTSQKSSSRYTNYHVSLLYRKHDVSSTAVLICSKLSSGVTHLLEYNIISFLVFRKWTKGSFKNNLVDLFFYYMFCLHDGSSLYVSNIFFQCK